ncbi:unnamed protein product [Parnassius mnemosyne]|uniref:FP protein C-terminal domain-containing protein n=1 Tax=Parnassius mnemosyne TaxID=213953 RepID=A0AAV1LR77_9NEOP
MNICESCSKEFNDGAQCYVCKKRYDFGCAGITERGFRNLGADRRAQWKCLQCKMVSFSPSRSSSEVTPGGDTGGESATLDVILKEIREMKKLVTTVPSVIEDIKSIKVELNHLKESCEYNNSSLKSFQDQVSSLERGVSQIEKIQNSFAVANKEISNLKSVIETKEQWSRLSNVEVKGIPLKPNENLFEIAESMGKAVGYEFHKSQINYISRVPMFNTKEKAIIINFINHYVKEEFIAAARACKTLEAKDVGFGGNRQRVFVNDHLTPEHKKLLTKTRTLAKDRGYSYIWVKYGKIHIRKNNTSPVLIIAKEADLNKIA